MKITKNFDLKELTVTNTGLHNVLPLEYLINAMHLFINIVQPARDYLSVPIQVNSCYRSPEINKLIGGSSSSQHLTACAVDLLCSDNRRLFHHILDRYNFDQLIWEGGNATCPAWVHVLFDFKCLARKQVLYKY